MLTFLVQESMRLFNRLLSNAYHRVSDQRQTIYLTHVKWITGKQHIEKYFSRFGKIQDVSLFFDAETGLHRGFASLRFEKPEAATAALQSKPHVIDGDIVGIEFFQPLNPVKSKFKTM
uniref:RRM domain-containing protein n=1 Tax=Panagrolaimus sp. PS1159 TaxID=55785 RepID=A0AC35ERP4_9BILA